MNYAMIYFFASTIVLMILVSNRKFALSGLLHVNWMMIGILGMTCLYYSPEVQLTAIKVLNYCSISGDIMKNEQWFEKTLSPLMYGFESLV